MSICHIEKCENTLLPNSKLKTCAQCRASMRRWEVQSPARFFSYTLKLKVRSSRATNISGTFNGGKRRTW